jgi:peptidoglycan/LPS O-acetylase OafA/YrhL
MNDFVLSLLVLAAFALAGGAIWQWRRRGMDRNIVLMLVLAAVMLMNVAIWVVPGPDGAAPADRSQAGP